MFFHNQAFLLQKLNQYCQNALNEAANMVHSYGHKEITLDHFLLKLISMENGDVPYLFQYYGIDVDEVKHTLLSAINRLPPSLRGNPQLSISLHDILTDAWLIASENEKKFIRSLDIYRSILKKPFKLISYIIDDRHIFNLTDSQLISLTSWLDTVSSETENLNRPIEQTVIETTQTLTSEQPISPFSTKEQSVLGQYTIDLTDKAQQGKIDPVLGRESEIRQMIDILTRRRKNNPILVGDPGVGKTALAEGLALKIAQEQVPKSLRNTHILSLDMGLLQAGAGVKGAFEQRLKNIIEAIQTSSIPILLFIDEAHTLIGAGNQAGGSDAANLLKPALARGELRTIAATTWSEYKQYFEQDAALERRFQMITIEEPDDDKACLMLRGLQKHYANYHNVHIQDDAIITAVKLSRRYINGRQLPDKAIDLLDTAAARVRISLDTPPLLLDNLRAEETGIEHELQALHADLVFCNNASIQTRIDNLFKQRQNLQQHIAELMTRYQQQSSEATKFLQQLEDTETKQHQQLQNNQKQEEKLVYLTVDSNLITQIIADWTGIPTGKLLKNEATQLLQLDTLLKTRIIGQDEALESVADTLRYAKMGIRPIHQPLGVFLLTGPSGVGKTETAIALAEILFGSENSLIRINLSEYQEAHTVSQLKGSPPGYIGYGQGGILTEAVRKKPYSIVLLDEVEKAHRDVLNLFYQVFDKGIMRDGEGREIDFKNTIIIMTSNLGSDELLTLFESKPEDTLNQTQLQEWLYPLLQNHFQTALLARMQLIVYQPLNINALATIVQIKLNNLKKLLMQQQCQLSYDENLVNLLVQSCEQTDLGARNIDMVLNRQILPSLTRGLLLWQSNSGDMPSQVKLSIKDGELDIFFANE